MEHKPETIHAKNLVLKTLQENDGDWVTSRQIQIQTGFKDTKIRQMIKMLNEQDRILIVSSGRGFMLCDDVEMLDKYILNLTHRCFGMFRRIRALKFIRRSMLESKLNL